jgi:hypothetical protein
LISRLRRWGQLTKRKKLHVKTKALLLSLAEQPPDALMPSDIRAAASALTIATALVKRAVLHPLLRAAVKMGVVLERQADQVADQIPLSTKCE